MSSGLSTSLAVILAALTTVGVILAAVITAVAAERRQKRDLEEEGNRQKRQLEHDRRVREVQELRAVLDAASDAAAAASLALSQFHAALQVKYHFGTAHSEALRLHGEYYDKLQRAADQQDRIALRIGRQHAAYAKYANSVAWLDQAGQSLTATGAESQPAAMTAEVKRKLEVVNQERRAFTEAARQLVGTELSLVAADAETTSMAADADPT